MIAPAARSRLTIGASPGTLLWTNASEPAVVCMRSAVAMLSFTRIGMPCSGPRTWPRRRSRSRCTAMAIASGFVSITAPSRGVQRGDTTEIAERELAAGEVAGGHQTLQLGNGRLEPRWRRWWPCRGAEL
jgi:hypothetical protein